MRAVLAGCLLIAGFALPLSAWAVDTDGDGVDDSVDAFPNNAEATVDTDGDGQPDSIDNTKLPVVFWDYFYGTAFQAGWIAQSSWSIENSVAKGSGGGGNLSRVFDAGPNGGTLTFLHRISNMTSTNLDVGDIKIDGVVYSQWYSRYQLQESSISIPAGSHTVTWYGSCPSGTSMMGCLTRANYLDNVVFRSSSLVADVDDDNDGVLDYADKFPLNSAESADTDNDGVGNNTDTDDDGDGLQDISDNCSVNSNADQLNTDGDTQGDVCDTDDDNDGVLDTTDQCPLDPACSVDTDGDGIDNVVDTDDDNDSVLDFADNCLINSNADQLNTDGDAQGNVCDSDDDNDGVADVSDKFPLNVAASSDADNDGFAGSWNAACDAVCQSNSGLVLDNCPSNANANQLNTDGDTQGDACDTDDDNDGVADLSDKFPLNAAASSDIDADGFPGGWHVACDLVCQSHSGLVLDNCPTVANANQLDTDGDGAGDVCDNASYDNDDDGLNNLVDNCPNNSNVDQLNADGDSQGNSCDTDDDNDGVADTADKFPLNATETLDADNDGIGDNADTDDDNDGDLDSDEIAQGTDPLDNNSNSSAATIISFENGLPAGWTKPAAANVGWVSDATQASHLSKSLRTAATGNSQKAQVQMTAHFSGTSFSFDVKVSTEANNDNFRVYVDGTGQVTKSGELGWQTITVPITAGTHTIKFEYLKNSSIASGSDAVWIDKFTYSNGDVDNDGQANTVDLDDDNDGVPDHLDPEPFNAANSSVWPLNSNYKGSAMRESQGLAP